jgi:DNA modification methylase
MPAGKRVPMDVWYGANWGRIQGNNKERRHGHDNQLPEAYLERVILATSNEGDLVLDPFVGSGTTATVARAYGRRFIGSEFSRANAVSAWERIRDIGMINKGKALGGSSAIFKARGVGKNNAVVRSLRGEAEAATADDTDGKA